MEDTTQCRYRSLSSQKAVLEWPCPWGGDTLCDPVPQIFQQKSLPQWQKAGKIKGALSLHRFLTLGKGALTSHGGTEQGHESMTLVFWAAIEDNAYM